VAAHVKSVARVAALVLLLAGTGIALARWVFHPLHCSHVASFAAAALEADDARAGAFGTRAELASCNCVTPPDAVIPVARGAAARVEGDPRAAIADYQRALAIDRRPEIYFQLGLAQLEAGDRPAAIQSLARACAFDPARLTEISDAEIRQETRRYILAKYGSAWMK
jgi:tetratricopeptide (TPR) repeat protein